MIINIGSTNPVKVEALREVLSEYPGLRGSTVNPYKVQSGVSEQPLSLIETVKGAKYRAQAAYTEDSAFGVGLESGLIEVPFTRTGYLDLCACVIYNGYEVWVGLSSAFECPKPVIDLVKGKGYDLNQAFLEAGLTDEPKLGNYEGAVGLLTRNRVTRKEYTKQALRMALIHFEQLQAKKDWGSL